MQGLPITAKTVAEEQLDELMKGPTNRLKLKLQCQKCCLVCVIHKLYVALS